MNTLSAPLLNTAIPREAENNDAILSSSLPNKSMRNISPVSFNYSSSRNLPTSIKQEVEEPGYNLSDREDEKGRKRSLSDNSVVEPGEII